MTTEILADLEARYFDQPLMGQRADLIEINNLRVELGLPVVDARLRPVESVVHQMGKTNPPADHTEARALYDLYLARRAELKPHQDYAERVTRATHGAGMTPVRPLAVMGTGGGPLLCDHCSKPIPLEGGRYNKVLAHVAWAANPVDGWKSYILGGVVITIETNGTLRVYHGHWYAFGNDHARADGCCKTATDARDAAWDRFVMTIPTGAVPKLLAFLADPAEFPDQDTRPSVNDIVGVLWGFDPGIGINLP